MLLCHNLDADSVAVGMSLPELAGKICVDLFDRSVRLPIADDGGLDLELAAYGAR